MTIVLSIVVCCFVFHCVTFALFLFSSSMLFLLFPLPTLVLIRLTNLSSLCQCLQFTHVAVIPLIGASSAIIPTVGTYVQALLTALCWDMPVAYTRSLWYGVEHSKQWGHPVCVGLWVTPLSHALPCVDSVAMV